jgi:hypothetical protein
LPISDNFNFSQLWTKFTVNYRLRELVSSGALSILLPIIELIVEIKLIFHPMVFFGWLVLERKGKVNYPNTPFEGRCGVIKLWDIITAEYNREHN